MKYFFLVQQKFLCRKIIHHRKTMAKTKPTKNKLASEPSPYLQQHATNPVQWYAWGDEAFIQATQQDKPIFLSIGYATCHWCHVMAKESFEDEEVARILNDSFICVKVDREERPDLDNIYMKVCQLLTGSGGWPLTIIMTPDKKPFFAATYIPKTPRFGLIGILQLTEQINRLWRTQRDRLITSAEEITKTLTSTPFLKNSLQQLDSHSLEQTYEQLVAAFDEQYGGFSSTPKFPTPHTFFFLLRYWKRTKNTYALTMVERTLEHLRFGGIFDQVGYGFHRYATDREWNKPHFEKMLYDQALLILAYVEGFQVTRNPLYRQTAEEIITYVLREMTSAEGGFFTAQDADSEGEEGKFYTWTAEELQSLLSSDDFRICSTLFGIAEKGINRDATPSQASHRRILSYRQSLEQSAHLLGLTQEQLTIKIRQITKTLYEIRKKRIPPLKDDKILSDWNGLMIAALAKAGMVFDEKSFLKAAEKAAGFLKKTMIHSTGQILHRFRQGSAGIAGFADDYAFTIWGFLELYQGTFDIEYLQTALALHRYYIDHFWDRKDKGFFFSESPDSAVLRTKEWYDGAIPSANSISAINLLRLSRLTAETKYEAMAAELLCSVSAQVASALSGYTCLLNSMDFTLGLSQEIIVVGVQDDADTQKILREIRQTFLPNSVVILLSPYEDRLKYLTVFPFLSSFGQMDKKTTVYICTNHQCQKPVTEVQDLKELLS